MCAAIADVLKGSRVAKEVEEGDEDDGFWAELGGKSCPSRKLAARLPLRTRRISCRALSA
jgi:hypothetical protein